jgi:tetratricopeptide (TPR) repeat protein
MLGYIIEVLSRELRNMCKYYLILFIVSLSFLNCDFKDSKVRADECYSRGVERYWKKDYIGAINDFDKAIKLDNKDIAFRYWRGLANFELKKYETAIQDFSTCIDLDPGYFQTYLYRGVSKFFLKDYGSAINDFDKVLEMVKVGDVYAYYYRGLCKIEIGNEKAGRDDLEEAMNRGFDPAIDAFDHPP